MEGVCQKCDKKRQIWAKGLCKSCYNTSVANKEKIAEYQKQYQRENRERLREYKKEYLRHNPQVKETKRYNALLKQYRIGPEQLNTLLAQTSCAICGGSNQLCIDHNHTTGQVRERLCKGCNFSLGLVERKAWLIKAKQYLVKHEQNSQ